MSVYSEWLDEVAFLSEEDLAEYEASGQGDRDREEAAAAAWSAMCEAFDQRAEVAAWEASRPPVFATLEEEAAAWA